MHMNDAHSEQQADRKRILRIQEKSHCITRYQCAAYLELGRSSEHDQQIQPQADTAGTRGRFLIPVKAPCR